MRGFFFNSGVTKPEKVKVARDPKSPSTSKKTVITDPCEACGLYKGCLSPKMKYTGKGEKEILIIAEAPGKTEDETGVQLIGDAGQLLRKNLKKLNYDLDRDFWKTNTIICRPPDNRLPTKKEIKMCRGNIDNVINTLKPKHIWLMGGVAVDGFLSGRFSNNTISTWQGKAIPFKDYWVHPMYHPSFILRNNDEKTETLFLRGLQKSIELSEKNIEPKIYSIDDKVKVLLDHDKVIKLLQKVKDKKPSLVFDYETNALSPHLDNPKIFCIGICFEDNVAYSFPLSTHPQCPYDDIEIKNLWSSILTDPKIAKVAQNLKFESKWGKAFFKVTTTGWVWDTMVTQHILDSSPGVTGLKFQSFIRWGVGDYEKEIGQYFNIKTKENSLHECPIETLCKYNAADALLEMKLYKEQQKEIRRDRILVQGNNFFFKGILAIRKAEDTGICTDEKYYNEMETELTKKIERLKKELLNSKEALSFKDKIGREIKLGSSKDIRELFFGILKLSSAKTTASGLESTDKDVMEELEHPFAKKLVSLRKALKTRDTYLGQFKREVHNGKIHPNFNLHLARSFRSSADQPNFQNIPVRDEESKKIVRSGIIPSKGNKLMEIDYSAIEVRIMACVSHDPELIKYIEDPSTDMHRDEASDIFLAREDEVSKDMRFYAKNGFVFPEFYGSWYKNCATNLWAEVPNLKTAAGYPLMRHLARQGIRNYDAFEKHVKEAEDGFWFKFKKVKEWQEEHEKRYIKNGYVDMPFGFKRSGFLSRNEMINTPIQGTAFHCLLWSFIRLIEMATEENWKTRIIGQIHDSIIFDLCPEEQSYVIKTAKRVMCEDIRVENKFLIVPLEAEVEITPINKSWYEKGKING